MDISDLIAALLRIPMPVLIGSAIGAVIGGLITFFAGYFLPEDVDAVAISIWSMVICFLAGWIVALWSMLKK